MEEERGRFWHENSAGCYQSAGSVFLLRGPWDGERCFACRTPAKTSTFVCGLLDKLCPGLLTDRYRITLDGFRDPDSAFRTVAEGLRVDVEDALIQ